MNMKKNMYSQTDNTKTQKLVQTNMGSMPLEDYLEIMACQYGFSCLLIFGLRSTLLPSLPYFNCTKNPRYDCPEIFSIQGTKLTPWLFADSQICLL